MTTGVQIKTSRLNEVKTFKKIRINATKMKNNDTNKKALLRLLVLFNTFMKI